MRSLLPTGLVLVFSFLFLWGCDPSQKIILCNPGNSEARFVFCFDKAHRSGLNNMLSASDSASWQIRANACDTIHLRLGTWDMEGRLDSFASSLDSILIQSDSSSQRIEGAGIKAYLQKRVQGRHAENLVLSAE